VVHRLRLSVSVRKLERFAERSATLEETVVAGGRLAARLGGSG